MSFQPTGIFNASTFDGSGNFVGEGSIDNIRMTEAAKFTGFTVTPTNSTNGAISNYTVTYTPLIPMSDGDLFYVVFPKTIRTPKEPTCTKGDGLSSVLCTSETGRIVVTLVNPCTLCTVSFTLNNITNAPTMVPSNSLISNRTSKAY